MILLFGNVNQRALFNVRCDHERGQSADDCLADIIGENNSEHFFVATQDSPLRKKLHEVSMC